MKRLLCLLCLASCTPSQPLDTSVGKISALNEALARTKGSAIPTASEAAISEWEEILEAATFTGHIGRRALQQLENIEAQQRDAILLSLVGKKNIPSASKRIAYSRLAADGGPEIVPRLILRLRYEKDHSSNVAIAQALLRHGNGSGLAAIRAILSFPSNHYPEAQQAAREFIDAWYKIPGMADEEAALQVGKAALVNLAENMWFMGVVAPAPDVRFHRNNIRGIDLERLPPLVYGWSGSFTWSRD